MTSEEMTPYQKNRNCIPFTELAEHNGKWVAFSADGGRIVASADNLATLAAVVEKAGLNSSDVVLERIELDTDEAFLGGAELL